MARCLCQSYISRNDCLIDILVDLKRLDDFHEIRQTAYEKVLAYASSWIIRRKPFQVLENVSGKPVLSFINEKFALFLLLKGAAISDRATGDAMKDLCNRVLYHLIYRDTGAKVLELFLYGLKFGKECC